jgi:hypothetical protein
VFGGILADHHDDIDQFALGVGEPVPVLGPQSLVAEAGQGQRRKGE